MKIVTLYNCDHQLSDVSRIYFGGGEGVVVQVIFLKCSNCVEEYAFTESVRGNNLSKKLFMQQG